MNIPSQYTIPTIYARSPRFNFNMNTTDTTDRDAQAQKALLGESVYILDTNSPSSPLNTPSPIIDGLSPLSVASHLQDACDANRDNINNPFLDASWKTELETEADHYYQPVRLVVSSSPNRKTRSVSVPVTPEPSAATLLPTIQEAASSAPYHRSAPPPPPIPRRLKQTNTTMHTTTYSLPPSALGITTSSSPFSSRSSGSSSTTQIRRRPSPFPLGPPPPPPAQRRARYEPRPHIVDLATEQFNLKPTSSNTSSSTTNTNTTTSSALEQERARQWKLWDEERLRSLEMTREAAKNNRVQTSRAHPSSSNPAVRRVQEKPPSSKVPTPSKSSVKRRWWCFGNGATESDVEDSHNEKPISHHTHDLSRSSSRISSTASSATEEDDEDEWDEARTVPAESGSGSGLIGFGCARKHQQSKTSMGAGAATGESRRRATLKKRAL